MIISYKWLQDCVDLETLGFDVQAVAKALSSVGLAVEEIAESDGDYILNLDVTSNRPDCLSHLGVARELAAYYRLLLRKPDFSAPPAEAALADAPEFSAAVDIEAPDLCPRYAARVMTGVRVAESPAWLKARLEGVGQRPINNLVDVTNYVLHLVGHPLHAFDLDRLAEHRIVVRCARPGETMLTLDGVSRELSPAMLAICDASAPVAVAGVMGGLESEISCDTRTILLESAYFAPSSIRSTSRALGLRTEASHRFERGADPEMPVRALNLACRMIQQIAGGVCVGPVIDENPRPFSRRALTLRARRLRQVVGLDFDPQFVGEILRRLEFDVEATETGQWLVHAPGFRPDIELEDDLVEEVARHHGYDNIPSTYPAPARTGAFLETKGQEDALATLLRGFGCFEAVNYVFSTPAREAVFWGAEPPMVPISNPLTEEDTHLRTILTPGLVECVRRNLNHGTRDVRLFEFGRVFRPESAEALYRFREFPCLGVIGTGTFYRSFWSGCRDDFSFYHLKGMVERVFEAVGRKVRFERNAETPFLHPGVAARVLIDDEPIGVAGKLHPRVREKFKFLQSVFLAEFSLEKLYSTASPEPHYRALSRFPTMERDLSFVVDKSVEYDKIDLAIKSLNVAELVDIRPIDLYQGSELPPGKVSVAVRLTFAHALRTLTQEEVNARTQEVWEALSGTLGAERRA